MPAVSASSQQSCSPPSSPENGQHASTTATRAHTSGNNNNNNNKNNNNNNNETSNNHEPDAFDAIIDQLTALGTQIDQELSNCHKPSPPPPSSSSLLLSSSATSNSTNHSSCAALPITDQMDKASMMFYNNNSNNNVSNPGVDFHSGLYYQGPSTFVAPPSSNASNHAHNSNENVLNMNSASTMRTDSPDNDSAFSDTISLISSEQSSSSSSNSSRMASNNNVVRQGPTVSSQTNLPTNKVSLVHNTTQVNETCLPTSGANIAASDDPNSAPGTCLPNEQRELFVEHSNCNSVAKDSKDDSSLYIKLFAQDNGAKSLLADERMTIGDITRHLAEKNHIALDISQCIIEHMPQLYLERFYEDHESLVENILHWSREGSTNKLYFMQRNDKYEMFYKPERYLIGSGAANSGASNHNVTLKSNGQLRTDLIDKFFSKNSTLVPEIEGYLHLRSEGKKVWKKYFFTLKSSGLYYCVKGKPKSTKDLICLTTFEMNCLYFGFGWRKKYKAPNDFGFAIKHPQIQTKSPKQIKYLCAETNDDLQLWTTGIRMAKYGKLLRDNFEKMNELKRQMHTDSNIKHETNNNNNNTAYSSSYAYPGSVDYHSSVMMRSSRMSSNESVRTSCDSSSSSSGCISEQSSLASTPSSSGGGQVVNGNSHHGHHYHLGSPMPSAFDTDYPLGTIKRKPSVSMIMQPKIPLTNTTRNLALQSEDALLEVDNDDNGNGAQHDGDHNAGNNNDEDYGGVVYADFQRFKSGTLLRRSNMDIKSGSPQSTPKSPYFHHHQHQHQLTVPVVVHQRQGSDSSDDLPPPPPSLLKEAESTLSLNTSFPPPPSPESLQVHSSNNNNNNPPSSPAVLPQADPVPMSSLTCSSSLQHLPHDLGSPLHLPPVPSTPQPQPKNPQHRLSRRLSDLSPSSNMFFNFRQQQQQQQTQSFDLAPGPMMMAPASRASIAASESYAHTGFATLKAYNTNNRGLNRLQRQTIEAWNKYGTSPRIKPDQHNPMTMGNKFGNYESFNASWNANYAPFGQNMQASHVYNASGAQNLGSSQFQYTNGGQFSSPGMVETQNSMPKVSSRSDECHYMSISPHLLHRHQQMQQAQQQQTELQQQAQQQFFIRHHTQQQQQQQQTQSGPGPSTVPEQAFLANMERVMQRKWNVAQMLRKEPAATPGQVLGFRDSAYLPPGSGGGYAGQVPEMNYNGQLPTAQAYYNGGHCGQLGQASQGLNGYSDYPPPPPPAPTVFYPPSNPVASQQIYARSSIGAKSVRISECGPTILGGEYHPPPSPSLSSNSSASHYSMGMLKRVPPPPPKRSNSTHLSSGSVVN